MRKKYFIVLIVLLVISVIFNFVQIRVTKANKKLMNNGYSWVSHTNKVIVKLYNLKFKIKEFEISKGSINVKIDDIILEVSDYVNDNPVQASRLKNMSEIISESKTDYSKAYELIDEMINMEKSLLEKREKTLLEILGYR